MIESKNYIAHWVGLSRVVEIAMVLDSDVSIYANIKDYPGVFDDFKIIKEFYPINFSANALMKCEITEPPPLIKQNKRTGFETLDAVKNRADNAKKLTLKHTVFNEPSLNLQGYWAEKMGASVKDIEDVQKIAEAIAKLAGTDVIKVEHVAEAIQYVSTPKYDVSLISTDDILIKYLLKQLESKKLKRDNSESLSDKVSLGGQIKALNNVLHYYKTHFKKIHR